MTFLRGLRGANLSLKRFKALMRLLQPRSNLRRIATRISLFDLLMNALHLVTVFIDVYQGAIELFRRNWKYVKNILFSPSIDEIVVHVIDGDSRTDDLVASVVVVTIDIRIHRLDPCPCPFNPTRLRRELQRPLLAPRPHLLYRNGLAHTRHCRLSIN